MFHRFEELENTGILLLTENVGVGGIPRYVILIAEGLMARGIPVQVAAVWPNPNNWLQVQCQQKGIPLTILATKRSVTQFPSCMRRLANMIRERQYALIHTQGPYSDLVGRAAYLLAGRRTRMVATSHGISKDPRLGGKMFILLDWHTFCWNHMTIANSQDTARRLEKLAPGVGNVQVVLHGVVSHAETERLRQTPVASDMDSVIGFIGRLSLEKGCDVLIEAVRLLNERGLDFRIVIVGDGPERLQLEKQVIEYGLQTRIHFEGWQANVESYYQQASVIVVPSRRESLGLTVLEAMLYGCAVIGSRVQGILEIVTDGQTGLLVSPQNPGELAQAIELLLTDHSLCHRLGESGRQYVLAQHTIEGMIDQTIAVYQQALESATK